MKTSNPLNWRRGILVVISFCAACQSPAIPTAGSSPSPTIVPTPNLRPSEMAATKPPSPRPPSTATAVPSPTSQPIHLAGDYQLQVRATFVTYHQDQHGNLIDSQLWIWEPPLPEPQLILSTANLPGITILPQYAWSHSGQALAFLQLDPDNFVAITTLDLTSRQTRNITPPLPAENYAISLNSSNWSADDRWLHVLALENGATTSGIADVQSGTLHFLDYQTQEELLAWSPIMGGHFIKIARPNFPEIDADTLSISAVGTSPAVQPLDYTPALGTVVQATWSPDGKRAMLEVLNANGRRNLIRLGISDGSPRVVLLSDTGFSLVPCWSPDGRWITARASNRSLVFLNTEAINTMVTIKAPAGVEPIGWLPDSSRLLFQDGVVVYAVAPFQDDVPVVVQDFNNLLPEGTSPLRIALVPVGNVK